MSAQRVVKKGLFSSSSKAGKTTTLMGIAEKLKDTIRIGAMEAVIDLTITI